MSAPQLLQASPAIGATAYVNQIYPVDAVSKLIQIPATGRIAKITGTPVVGNALTFTATAAGTVESPDSFGFATFPTQVSVPAIARDLTTPQALNMIAGTQITYNSLAYDTSSNNFGNVTNQYTLPDLLPVTYSADASVSISVATTASLFYATANLILDDGVTPKTIGTQTIFINGVTLGPYVFGISISGQCTANIANTKVYVQVIGSYSTGAIPAVSAVGGRFAIREAPVLS